MLALALTSLPAQPITTAGLPALLAASAAPAAPNAGERCFATTLAASGQFSNTDSRAVFSATSTAAPGGLVKVAGYCAGYRAAPTLFSIVYTTQTVSISGGYTHTNWNTYDPVAFPTRLDGEGGGGVVTALGANTSLRGMIVTNGVYSGTRAGIEATGTLTLTDMLVISNTSIGPNGRDAGVYAWSNAFVVNSRFISNTAQDLGGGAYFNGSATITGSEFMSNTAQFGGGARFFAATEVNQSALIANLAREDGGAVQTRGNLTMTIVVLARNTARINGSALYATGGINVVVMHNTIASPTVAAGNAIYATDNARIALTNTLIASHTIGLAIGGVSAATISEDHTLFSGVTTPYSGTVSAGANSITGTAGFVNPAADNYRLTAVSAAIDKGRNLGVMVDFDGQARSQPAGSTPDIGYDEAPYVPARRMMLPVVVR